jgi:hypothetical protein
VRCVSDMFFQNMHMVHKLLNMISQVFILNFVCTIKFINYDEIYKSMSMLCLEV